MRLGRSLGSGEPRSSGARAEANAPRPIRLHVARDGLPAYYAFCPARLAISGEPVPVALCIHGISRDAEQQIRLLAPYAQRSGVALLAPCFDAQGWRDYQRLGRRGRGPRADRAIQAVLAGWAERHGLQVSHELLIGYSGGAQFAHRYAMAHPDRVRAVVLAAAGWYLWPDARRPYPQGLHVAGELPGVRFEAARFLRVPMRVFVGTGDVARDEALRTAPGLDRRQGRDRLERAHRWTRAMRDAALERGLPPRVELRELPGVGHSFPDSVEAGLGRSAFAFFEGLRGEPS